MVQINILTWNIFWGLGYPKNKFHHALCGIRYLYNRFDKKVLQKISNEINNVDPDIFGLQEIDLGSYRNGRFNQVKYIKENTKSNFFKYAPEKSFFGYTNDGNALFSKYAFNDIKVYEFPKKIEKRNLILAKIKIKDEVIYVLNTHLGAHSFNKDERIKQVKYISKILESIKKPIILLGDFNCNIDSKEFRLLLELTKLKNLNDNPTYKAYNSFFTYDNILVSKEFRIVKKNVLDIKHSDHLPFFVSLKTI